MFPPCRFRPFWDQEPVRHLVSRPAVLKLRVNDLGQGSVESIASGRHRLISLVSKATSPHVYIDVLQLVTSSNQKTI